MCVEFLQAVIYAASLQHIIYKATKCLEATVLYVCMVTWFAH